jgi:hypothetical protein
MGGTVEVIIQGGGVGLAVAALGLVSYALRALLNHLPHMSSDMKHMASTLELLMSENRQHHLDILLQRRNAQWVKEE